MFERVIRESGNLRSLIRRSVDKRLNICAVGGGPGTELLGLAKFLLRKPWGGFPKKITFTVLDNVPHWAETWQQLADACEDELQRKAAEDSSMTCPAIAPAFLPLDVLKVDSYKSYAYQFSQADVIVFNYLFSENKNRLADAEGAVARLHEVAPTGCVFVVIDRLENSRQFTDDVVAIFKKVFGRDIAVQTFGGTLDHDEQTSDMGDLLSKSLGTPRVKFFTDLKRAPTVSWFTAVKE